MTINTEEQFVWHPIEPLSPLLQAQPLEKHLIPPEWAPWLEDCATRLGCPTEMIFLFGLSAFSNLTGRLFCVQPKEKDTQWKCQFSQLWTMVVAPSGSKKSPAMNAALEPLYKIESMLRKEFCEAEKTNASSKKSLKTRLVKLRKNEGSKEEIAEIENELDKLKVEMERLVTQEATTQAICVLLQSNPLGIGLIFDELSGFFKGLERDNRQTDRAFFLQSFNGNQAFNGDTISRGHVHVDQLWLQIMGAIQPKIFQKYVTELQMKANHGDGLLARFQLVCMPSIEGNIGIDAAPDEYAKQQYERTFLAFADHRKKRKSEKKLGQSKMVFSSEGQLVFNEFYKQIHVKISESQDFELYHDFLAKQLSTMPLIAGLFRLIKACNVDSFKVSHKNLSDPLEIDLESANRAKQFCEWLQFTAQALYCGKTTPLETAARELIKKGSQQLVTDMTTSEVINKNWKHLNIKTVVESAVSMLQSRNFLKLVSRSTQGRNRTEILWNPLLVEAWDREFS